MARGHDDASDDDDGPVLSPEELDITDDEHVAEIDDGRFVVSPNDPIDDVPTTTARSQTPEPTSEPASGPSGGRGPDPNDESVQEPGQEPVRESVSEENVREWLVDQFEESNSRYGFDVTATFDGSVQQRRMVSNDVVTIFESLVLWYAQQIDSTTPVEEVLGILLMEANVPVRYPPSSLKRLLETTDLSPEDSVADLMKAVGEDDGFRI